MEEFKQKLQSLKERIWWAGEHNFVDPVSLEDVKTFETKFDVQLPEEYRWFITNIANGIVADKESGLGIDILKPHDWVNYWFEENEYNPSKPFPLNKRVVFYRETDNNTSYPYETSYDTKGEMCDYHFGEVSLMSSGCGADDFLVVKGEEYGNVWLDNYSSNEEVFPAYDIRQGKKRLGFTDWLELQANGLYSF